MPKPLPAAALLLLALLPRAALAHDSTFSASDLDVGEDAVAMALRIRNADLAFALEALDADRDAALTVDEMESGRDELEAYLLGKIEVALDGAPCPGRLLGIQALPVDELEPGHPADTRLDLRFALARPPGKVGLRVRLFDDNDPFHQHLATVRVLGGHPVVLFFDRGSAHEVGESRKETPGLQRVSGALREGVLHILTGWDHLLFLAALILAVERPWALAGVVTGFTAGHTVTLLLAGLGVMSLPPRLTECAIAFSIAYVGFENTRSAPPRHRWRLALLFGLVHGFGFAANLRGRLPEDMLVLSLFLFNLGIELGQLGLVAVVWPALRLAARREGWRRRGPAALSWAIAAAGAALLAARLLGAPV